MRGPGGVALLTHFSLFTAHFFDRRGPHGGGPREAVFASWGGKTGLRPWGDCKSLRWTNLRSKSF